MANELATTSGETGEKRKLTRAEKDVLAVLVNPDFFKSDNAARIEASGVSPSRFYAIIADPWFQQQQQLAFLSIIRGSIGPVVQAAVDTASKDGRDGHADRKMILEMSGIYSPKSAVDVTSGGETLVKVLRGVSMDEL